nr:hypothetical protein CFP56_17436 [Quercus suber]
MPVTVSDGSLPPKTNLGGSNDGFSSSKPNIPDPTDETHERRPEFLDPFRFISIPVKARSSDEKKFSLKSKLDAGVFASFLLRSGDFLSNLSLMLWFFFDFCLDQEIFAQI